MNGRGEATRHDGGVSRVARTLLSDGVGCLAHTRSVRAYSIEYRHGFFEFSDLAVRTGEGNVKDLGGVLGIWRSSDDGLASVAVGTRAERDRGRQSDGGRRSRRADRIVDGCNGRVQRVVDDSH